MIGHPADLKLTFESFVIGPANRLAYAAARTAAEAPGSSYNPLFLYAGSGLGKTHLLMAIANLVRELHPESRVAYTTLERLLQDMEDRDDAGATYESASVFLVDDLQFLSTRSGAQATLFHLLDAHLVAGHQVVLACDRPPMEMDQVDDRLLRRFSGGLVVDITGPGLERRTAILERKLEERGAELPKVVIEEIARLAIDNVRQLQGALQKVLAIQRVESREVAASEIRSLLGDLTAPLSLSWLDQTDGEGRDEFTTFLSEVTRAVEQAVGAPEWREDLQRAIRRYEGEGFRTARLEALAKSEQAVDAKATLEEFDRDVSALRAAARDMAEVNPSKARHPAFFDPDRLAEAETMVREVRAAATIVDPSFLDSEKVVLEWPHLDDLVLEEFV
ncbi:MAG: DnaA ATPase domain-containing protein [Gemmatimonadota bacterium]